LRFGNDTIRLLNTLTVGIVGYEVEGAILIARCGSKDAVGGGQLPIVDCIFGCQAMTDNFPVYQVRGVVNRQTCKVFERGCRNKVIVSHANCKRICIDSACDWIPKS
jgi:hypothetical protein